MLFFKWAAALLECIKWEFVSCTAVVFSFVTKQTVAALHMQPISYIDNREFPDTKSRVPLQVVDMGSSRNTKRSLFCRCYLLD